MHLLDTVHLSNTYILSGSEKSRNWGETDWKDD